MNDPNEKNNFMTSLLAQMLRLSLATMILPLTCLADAARIKVLLVKGGHEFEQDRFLNTFAGDHQLDFAMRRKRQPWCKPIKAFPWVWVPRPGVCAVAIRGSGTPPGEWRLDKSVHALHAIAQYVANENMPLLQSCD
jgi:hypothetical protein